MYKIVRYNMSNNSDDEIENSMKEWTNRGHTIVGTAITKDSLGNDIFIVTYR